MMSRNGDTVCPELHAAKGTTMDDTTWLSVRLENQPSGSVIAAAKEALTATFGRATVTHDLSSAVTVDFATIQFQRAPVGAVHTAAAILIETLGTVPFTVWEDPTENTPGQGVTVVNSRQYPFRCFHDGSPHIATTTIADLLEEHGANPHSLVAELQALMPPAAQPTVA